MRNVLYITYDGLTDALGQSQILPYVIGLTKLGYQFSIISCEKPEKFEEGKQHIESICNEHHIDWHPLPYHKKPPILSTVKDVRAIRKKAFDLNHIKKFSMVHCRSYIASLVGLEMKRKKLVPFIFDMRGFWADERVDGKLWDLNNPMYKMVYRYFKSKEAAFVQYSNAIVSLTEAGKTIMKEWPTLRYSKKISVIPCSVDMNLFNRSTLSSQKLAELKQKINSPMVIGYYGSIGTWYMFNEMLAQFKAIKDKYPAAKFLIVSNDDWNPSFESALLKQGVDPSWIHFTKASREEMPYYIVSTQVALFFIQPCYSKLSSSPTKHGEIMSMGVPVITNSGVGDLDKIINASKTGYIVNACNTAEYVKAADAVEDLIKISPEHIRESAMQFYNLDMAIKKYADIYKMIG